MSFWPEWLSVSWQQATKIEATAQTSLSSYKVLVFYSWFVPEGFIWDHFNLVHFFSSIWFPKELLQAQFKSFYCKKFLLMVPTKIPLPCVLSGLSDAPCKQAPAVASLPNKGNKLCCCNHCTGAVPVAPKAFTVPAQVQKYRVKSQSRNGNIQEPRWSSASHHGLRVETKWGLSTDKLCLVPICSKLATFLLHLIY